MKKVLLSIMVLFALVLVTGCEKKNNNDQTTTTQAEEKKLSCSLTADGDTHRINLTYVDDKVSKATYSDTEKKASEAAAKAEYEKNTKEITEYNKSKGLSANASYSGTLVTTSITFTIADMDDKAKSMYEEIFGEIKDKGLEDTKTQFSGVGYTCK